jgi:Fur family ferric uptake transcriptional regulator
MPRDKDLSSAEQAWRFFRNYLSDSGMRITQPRRIVCDLVSRGDRHFTAEELVMELGKPGPTRVSRGTVYQTLSLMVRAGLLREMREAGREVRYDRTLGFEDHEHLLCEVCGKYIEFLDPEMHRLISIACGKAGFKQRVHRITVLGVCRTCQDRDDPEGT